MLPNTDSMGFRVQYKNKVGAENSENYAKFWTLGEGYDIKAPLDVFPKRALGAGAKSGLFVILRTFTWDLDYYCRGPVQGFKVTVCYYEDKTNYLIV